MLNVWPWEIYWQLVLWLGEPVVESWGGICLHLPGLLNSRVESDTQLPLVSKAASCSLPESHEPRELFFSKGKMNNQLNVQSEPNPYMLIIPAFRRWRQKYQKFKAQLYWVGSLKPTWAPKKTLCQNKSTKWSGGLNPRSMAYTWGESLRSKSLWNPNYESVKCKPFNSICLVPSNTPVMCIHCILDEVAKDLKRKIV